MGSAPTTSPMEQAQMLMVQKDIIETELKTQFAILTANSADMQTSLVDADGFPRADLDIYAVRNARVRIIELRNDLNGIMGAIGRALEGVYDPNLEVGSSSSNSQTANEADPSDVTTLKPFARVNGVAPGSPAAEAGLEREDLVIKFGHLTYQSFISAALQPLADLVAGNENQTITIKVLRSNAIQTLLLTPRKGWGGRGTLGCHIVPYSS